MARLFSIPTMIQNTGYGPIRAFGRRRAAGLKIGAAIFGFLWAVRGAAAAPLTLFTTQEDWAQWNNSATTGIQLTAINTASLDGNITTNGLGNNGSAGGSGTSGALQAT